MCIARYGSADWCLSSRRLLTTLAAFPATCSRSFRASGHFLRLIKPAESLSVNCHKTDAGPYTAGTARLFRAAAEDPASGLSVMRCVPHARYLGVRLGSGCVEAWAPVDDEVQQRVRCTKSSGAAAMTRTRRRNMCAFCCWRHAASVVSPHPTTFRLEAWLDSSLLSVPHQALQAKAAW